MADYDDTKAPSMVPRIDADDDVEGHRMIPRVDGGDDDVAGHRMIPKVDADDEDDVEGHFGYVRTPTSGGE